MNDENVINEINEAEELSEEITSLPTDEEISEDEPSDKTEESAIEPEQTESDTVKEAPLDKNADESELVAMREELEALRKELNEKISAFERMSRDIGEFTALYPEKNVSTVPDSVWESVREGIPLAAAYALYERKNAVRSELAARANEENNARATGPVGRDKTENFYTPDEVRAMSRSEVKKNYSKIIESMKKWN